MIAILDDEPDRLSEMLSLLSNRYPRIETITFDNAPDMIGWFQRHLQSCSLICLDHDLGPNRERDGKAFDPGTGRDVADLLASESPVCPVIIHTTNTLARPGMIMTLEEAGWKVSNVTPYSDTLWIHEVWMASVRDVLNIQEG